MHYLVYLFYQSKKFVQTECVKNLLDNYVEIFDYLILIVVYQEKCTQVLVSTTQVLVFKKVQIFITMAVKAAENIFRNSQGTLFDRFNR